MAFSESETINWKKSLLTPVTEIEYLGFITDLEKMTFSLPQQKIENIQNKCKNLLKVKTTTVRELAKVVGTITSSIQAVLPAPTGNYRCKLQKHL